MTQKEKELLLQDICSRLPYGVKLKIRNYDDTWKLRAIYTNGVGYATRDIGYPMEIFFEDCKPYLFPLSSMTKEQNLEYLSTCMGGNASVPTLASFKWCIKNHFDINNLIPVGLAEDATNKDIY